LLYRQDSDKDPFVDVLRISMEELIDFRERVVSGKTAMFPDIVNGLYRPDRGRSTLALPTSSNPNPVILERTAAEFEDYEGLGLAEKRWESPEDVRIMAYQSEG